MLSTPHMLTTLAWSPGWPELLVVLVVALLIFGRRLPEVGRSLGKGLVEFKKGLKGVQDDLGEVDQDIKNAGEQTQQLDVDADKSTTNNSEKAQTPSGS